MGKPVPNVPRRCRKVYDALLAAKKPMREIDLINATGQSCAGVKVRELRGLNPRKYPTIWYQPISCPTEVKMFGLPPSPPLVITKIRRSPDGKRTWAEHRLSRSWKVV